MKTAKPIAVFSLNNRRVLTCVVSEGNPSEFLGKELCFFSNGGDPKHIRIDGLSTVGDRDNNVYDFKISGETILESDITDASIVTDEALKKAEGILLKKGA